MTGAPGEKYCGLSCEWPRHKYYYAYWWNLISGSEALIGSKVAFYCQTGACPESAEEDETHIGLCLPYIGARMPRILADPNFFVMENTAGKHYIEPSSHAIIKHESTRRMKFTPKSIVIMIETVRFHKSCRNGIFKQDDITAIFKYSQDSSFSSFDDPFTFKERHLYPRWEQIKSGNYE